MIIVRLRGGLGNQLFQYAAGKALAQYHQVDLALDLYTYKKHPYRKFELANFNIDAPEASREEVHRFTGSNPVIRYLNKRENYFHCQGVFAQPHYHYYHDFFSLPPDIYLSGYWQSEKYFSNIPGLIREQFTVSQPLDSRNAELSLKLSAGNSIAVHVRRGDYTNATYGSFFGGLSEEYYMDAIEKLEREIPDPVFYFFSDNQEWCKKTFSGVKAEFIDHNQGTDSFKDLVLMSYCRHNIIANSTFSWWGAWLNENPEKKIIAPAQWFRLNFLAKKEPVYASRFYNTEDLIPASWTRM